VSTYLKLKDPGVRAALHHPALVGLPRLGRGAFCAVYDNGGTVLKLTCDPVSYEYAAGHLRPQGEHFPCLVNDWRDIGETSGGDALYLFEVEKLQPILRGSPCEVKRDAEVLVNLVDATWSRHRWRTTEGHVASYRALQELAAGDDLSERMREGLGELALFAGDHEGVLDFHKANLMLRDDTIVLNDVIVGEVALGKFNEARGWRL